MATFTITTAVNIDTLASKVGSDTYNINGGYLTVDQDTRYGTNQNTSAAMGNLTLSATLGGTVEFNSTKVRLIAYTGGSGTVPAYGTTISKGSASGILLTVVATLASAPTAVGAAMPATGFIKIRQWNSTEYVAGALTGITATASGASVPGWISIIGVDALTQTCNRLGTFKVRGDWFALGTTTGTRATTYQIPTNGSAVNYFPGVHVETAASSGVYEFYPCAGSTAATAANFATDEFRGRVCWIEAATGLLRFGHDGTNSTGGFIPESGRKVRIANIFFLTCTAAALTVNVIPNATLATRMEFLTSGGGVIDIENASINWYLNLNQSYSVRLVNTGISDNLTLTECAQPIAWSQVGVGQTAALTNFGLLSSLCFAGGTITDCVFTRSTMASTGNYTISWTDMGGFTFTNVRLQSYAIVRGNASTGSATLTRVFTSTFTGCTFIGGRIVLTTCTDITFTTSGYADIGPRSTTLTNPHYMFDLVTNCLRCKFDGIHFGGLFMTQPSNGLLNLGVAGCTAIKLRNVGTYASPQSLGSPRVDNQAWTRATTTATVTSTAHGLTTGDVIYTIVSSSIAAIVVGAKTITVTSVNTFTFTCLNAGAASGTLCYFGTVCTNVFVLAASAAANDVEIKRIYAPHTKTNLYTCDNSSKNIRMENVYSDFLNAFVVTQLNGTQRAVTGIPTLAAQTSVYGTHWFGNFIAAATPNQSAQAWTRATTTATVTSTNHGLRTGLLLNVLATSSAAAITLGQKTVTVIDANTFTFVCLNAGAASGTIDINPFVSRMGIVMNEASPDTTSQYTIDAGTPGFTSVGTLYMPTVNDQITFVHPDYVLGHTQFNKAELVMGTGTLTNYDITYAIDLNDGDGFGSFKNMSYPRAGGGGASASTNVTMTDTTGVNAGDYVFGTNIAPLAKVVSITNGTTIVVSIANVGVVSGILRFNQIPNEQTIDPSIGIKLKLRIKTSTTNATAISYVYHYTDSTDVSRAYQYPLDLIGITLTPLATGSEARAYVTNTSTEVDGFETSTGTSGVLNIPPNTAIDIVVLGPVSDPAVTYTPVRLQNVSFAAAQNLDVAQRIDRNFANP